MSAPEKSEREEKHQFHPTILREYDIRGVYGQTLTEDDAYNIGRAYAALLQRETGKANPTFAVGFDGRVSSPYLEPMLVEGLKDSGAKVVRIGLGPTPMLYFSVFQLEADGGIMVTGSHNPPSHNGFKMMIGKKSLFGERIKELGRIAAQGDYVDGTGKISDNTEIKEIYIKRLLAAYKSTREMKVAWDPGNGAAGEIVDELIKKLPGKHYAINTRIDGTFPNHHPDPTVPKNLEQLIALVKKEGCDLGLAFDGDADRIGIVDSTGRIIWGDQMMIIFARDILKRMPGATIIADVKASQTLFDEIARMGGKPMMWKTGHSLIKSKMQETGAPAAGEMSGHIFFAEDYYGFDDGIYSAIRMLNILAQSGESITALRDQMPETFSTEEIRLSCTEERKFQIAEEIKVRLSEAKADFSDVDGVRVKTTDGWWLLRASNTSPVLVARCESATADGLQRLERDLQSELQKSGIDYNAREDH